MRAVIGIFHLILTVHSKASIQFNNFVFFIDDYCESGILAQLAQITFERKNMGTNLSKALQCSAVFQLANMRIYIIYIVILR